MGPSALLPKLFFGPHLVKYASTKELGGSSTLRSTPSLGYALLWKLVVSHMPTQCSS